MMLFPSQEKFISRDAILQTPLPQPQITTTTTTKQRRRRNFRTSTSLRHRGRRRRWTSWTTTPSTWSSSPSRRRPRPRTRACARSTKWSRPWRGRRRRRWWGSDPRCQCPSRPQCRRTPRPQSRTAISIKRRGRRRRPPSPPVALLACSMFSSRVATLGALVVTVMCPCPWLPRNLESTSIYLFNFGKRLKSSLEYFKEPWFSFDYWFPFFVKIEK